MYQIVFKTISEAFNDSLIVPLYTIVVELANEENVQVPHYRYHGAKIGNGKRPYSSLKYIDFDTNPAVRKLIEEAIRETPPSQSGLTQDDVDQVQAMINSAISTIELIPGPQSTTPGPPGEPGSGSTVQVIASDNVGGHRVVIATNTGIRHFDQSDTNMARNVIGVSMNAASAGSIVTVAVSGAVNNPGWGLIKGAVYYAANDGLITTTPPISGTLLRIGISLDPDNLYVEHKDHIILI